MIFLIDDNRRGIARFAFGHDLEVTQRSDYGVLCVRVALTAPKRMEFLLDEDAAVALVNGVAQQLVLGGKHQIYVTDAIPPAIFPGLDLEVR